MSLLALLFYVHSRLSELALAGLLPVVAHSGSASLERDQVALVVLSMRESALISILARSALGERVALLRLGATARAARARGAGSGGGGSGGASVREAARVAELARTRRLERVAGVVALSARSARLAGNAGVLKQHAKRGDSDTEERNMRGTKIVVVGTWSEAAAWQLAGGCRCAALCVALRRTSAPWAKRHRSPKRHEPTTKQSTVLREERNEHGWGMEEQRHALRVAHSSGVLRPATAARAACMRSCLCLVFRTGLGEGVALVGGGGGGHDVREKEERKEIECDSDSEAANSSDSDSERRATESTTPLKPTMRK